MSRRKKQPNWHELLGLSVNDFIAAEQPRNLRVTARVYRNVASVGGGIAERLTCGHSDMQWIDREGRYCTAGFTPCCSGISRRRERPDYWVDELETPA